MAGSRRKSVLLVLVLVLEKLWKFEDEDEEENEDESTNGRFRPDTYEARLPDAAAMVDCLWYFLGDMPVACLNATQKLLPL